MNQFVLTTYEELLTTIREIPRLKTLEVKNPTAVIMAVSRSIDQLKTHLKTNPFPDRHTEVTFFKYEKPKFYSEYIYALELFTVESQRPHGNETILMNYYEQELRFVKRFFDQYRFLYQYYLLDGMELDDLYFRAGKNDSELLLPEAPDATPEFSAPGEFLFAKFMALEKLQDHLMAILNPAVKEQVSLLQWTGDKVNLVELAYGIFNTAQVNNGDVHISDIISWLERSFGLTLSRYPQIFSEIKSRKSVSKTRYLDHMSKMINTHIELGNAFIPKK